MKLLYLVIATVLVNNLVLKSYIGLNSILSSSKNNNYIIPMGFSIMLILTLSNIITKLIYDNLLVRLELEYLKIFINVIIILIIIELIHIFIDNFMNKIYRSMEMFMPVIMINNLFLGSSLLVIKNNLKIIEIIVYSIGISLGFMLISLILSSINYKYRFVDMPRHFKERSITFIALGLIALAFYGFLGLV